MNSIPRNTSGRMVRLPALLLTAALLSGPAVPRARAQWGNLNPQAQRHLNNARGYEAAGEAIRRAGEELQRQMREREAERRERLAEERRERQARDEERREQAAERQQEQIRRSFEQTLEIQRQQQEQINRTLAINRPAPGSAGASPASLPSAPANASTPAARPSPGFNPNAAPVVRGSALSGTPNDGAVRKPDWMPYQHVSDNIWVSYCKVSEKFDKGRPLWTWSLKNWNDRPVKSLWFEYLEDGKWRTDLVPYSLTSRAGHGGWGSFTAAGFQPPAIRITKIEFK